MSALDQPTERAGYSLLPSSDSNGQYGDGDQWNSDATHTPGPLALPRGTRIGILAGIWLATFLSVRPVGGILIQST